MKPAVTVLGGFLGAGKTTLLRHLLAQSAGRRWAVVVNDLAALNIDGALVRDDPLPGCGEVVELQGGCVCCSGSDDLGETIARLAAEERYEHILVESTGVAEPRGVAALFTRKNPFGRALADFATLSSLVTVLDAAFFLAEWRAYRDDAAPVRRWAGVGRESPALSLMIEQAECADLIVLNHRDRLAAAGGESESVEVANATAEDAARLEAIIRGLNPRAELRWCERGRLDADDVIGTARFDPAATVGAARWIRELNALSPVFKPGVRPHGGAGGVGGAAGAAASRHGFGAVIYRERRPFARDRLRALLERGLPGVLRAKGFCWTREQPDEMGFVSIAGGVANLETLNPWWAAMIERGRARLDERPASVVAAWVEPWGDRRQEIVFIGPSLDEAALRAALDGALA